jgi:hypothetical protein
MEKYIDTIAQIKAAVEEWLRKTVGNCEGMGTEDGGQVLIVPERLLTHTAKKDERIRAALTAIGYSGAVGGHRNKETTHLSLASKV